MGTNPPVGTPCYGGYGNIRKAGYQANKQRRYECPLASAYQFLQFRRRTARPTPLVPQCFRFFPVVPVVPGARALVDRFIYAAKTENEEGHHVSGFLIKTLPLSEQAYDFRRRTDMGIAPLGGCITGMDYTGHGLGRLLSKAQGNNCAGSRLRNHPDYTPVLAHDLPGEAHSDA